MAGFSFNLKPTYASGPLSVRMAEQALNWNMEDVRAAHSLVDLIIERSKAGMLAREFQKWCNSGEAPSYMNCWIGKWPEILFSSIVGEAQIHERHQSWLATSDFFPIWRYYRGTVFCSAHSKLDGIVARFDDPIWQKIYPPNGWLCGCYVDPVEDPRSMARARRPRAVTGNLTERCANWIEVYPDKILKLP